ncbi:MAG: DUF4269 domain-containing protein [Polyangiales bacterium]
MTLAELFALLAPTNPTLVGTFPLGLQVDGSDLDIVCEAHDLALLGLPCRRVHDATVAELRIDGMRVEVFAQPVPVARQLGFRHMIVEGRLLTVFPTLRDEVLALKRAGVKTEPAFASVLGLQGDPYQALLDLEPLSEAQLRARFADRLPAR